MSWKPSDMEQHSGSGTVLYVCTANLARSPLATGLQRLELDLCGRSDIMVESAGTHASPSADNLASVRDVAMEYGFDLSDHRARQVNREIAMSSDLVLTMTESQRSALVRLHPPLVSRTFTVLEMLRLVENLAIGVRASGPVQLAALAHRQRPLTPQPSVPEDIEDPIGKPMRHLRRLTAQLHQTVRTMTSLLAAQSRTTPHRG